MTIRINVTAEADEVCVDRLWRAIDYGANDPDSRRTFVALNLGSATSTLTVVGSPFDLVALFDGLAEHIREQVAELWPDLDDAEVTA